MTLSPDSVNGLFEVLAGAFISLSVLKLHKEKLVRGVSWKHVGFFWLWGAWNLYYYPSLDQWMSLVGGVVVMVMNTIWLSQLIYYTKRPGNDGV